MAQSRTGLPGYLSRQVRSARRFHRGCRATGDFEVVSAGYEQCSADYVITRRSFPWYGIELVACGGGVLELAGARRQLGPGVVFTYGPGVEHAISADAGRPPGKWFIDLAGAEAPELLARAGLAPGTVGVVPDTAPALAIFDLLVATGRHGGAPELLEALARALVLALAHPGRERLPGPALEAWRRCRIWLEANALRGAGVAEAARALGIPPATMHRLFARFDRTSPGAYLRRLRLQHAAERLAEGRDDLATIAADCGYSDAFHLSRAFAKAYGMPPRDFRATVRGPGPALDA